jgi:ArsR family transcriptional regulator
MENLKALYIEAESAIEMAALFQALANPKRLRILHMLGKAEDYFTPQDRMEGGVSPEGIKKALRLSQSTVSEFMAILLRTGLVRSSKKGKFVYYSRNDDAFARLVERINEEL